MNSEKAMSNSSRDFAFQRLSAGSMLLMVLFTAGAFGQTITLESLVLRPAAAIPKRYTLAGKNVSPPLVWRNLPADAVELALIFENIDEPRVHWLVYRIPASLPGLPEELPQEEIITLPTKLSGIIQGLTSFKQSGFGYRGPDPESGKGRRYRFKLYAINARLGLLPGLDKASLLTLIKGHIAGEGELAVTGPK